MTGIRPGYCGLTGIVLGEPDDTGKRQGGNLQIQFI